MFFNQVNSWNKINNEFAVHFSVECANLCNFLSNLPRKSALLHLSELLGKSVDFFVLVINEMRKSEHFLDKCANKYIISKLSTLSSKAFRFVQF